MCLVLYSSRLNLWKICDFGVTISTKAEEVTSQTSVAQAITGYRAPEVGSEASAYSTKIDIWALGCILYEVITGKRAFKSNYAVFLFSVGQQKLEFPDCLDLAEGAFAWETVCDMLRIDPSQRPEADILQEKFHHQLRRVLTQLQRMEQSGLAVTTDDIVKGILPQSR